MAARAPAPALPVRRAPRRRLRYPPPRRADAAGRRARSYGHRLRRRGSSWWRLRIRQRYPEFHDGSATRRALDGVASAEQVGALAQADQAERSRLARSLRLEADAIIADGQNELA